MIGIVFRLPINQYQRIVLLMACTEWRIVDTNS